MDLVKRSDLLEEVERVYRDHYEQSYSKAIHDLFNAVRRRIRRCATVDAVEVVHGHWVDGRNCSECGSSIPTDNRYDFISEKDNRFCFHCGAKMDGKSNVPRMEE